MLSYVFLVGTKQGPAQPASLMKALDDAERARQEQGGDEDWDDNSHPAEHNWGRGFRVADGADFNGQGEVGMDIGK